MQVHKESTVVSPEELKRLLQQHPKRVVSAPVIKGPEPDQRGFIIGNVRLLMPYVDVRL